MQTSKANEWNEERRLQKHYKPNNINCVHSLHIENHCIYVNICDEHMEKKLDMTFDRSNQLAVEVCACTDNITNE